GGGTRARSSLTAHNLKRRASGVSVVPKRGTDSGPRLTGLEQGLCKQGTACFIRLFTRTRFGRIKEVRGQLVSAKPDEETG
ncbi:hypothetical protein CH063_07603, partial [Colletotrichum higginsianum]